MIQGIRVIDAPNLVVQKGFDTIRRTWRERLFTLPWRPLRATREVPHYEPDPNLYLIPSGLLLRFYGNPPDSPGVDARRLVGQLGPQVFIGHPATINTLKKHADIASKTTVPGSSGHA